MPGCVPFGADFGLFLGGFLLDVYCLLAILGRFLDRFPTFLTGPADFSENGPKMGPRFFQDRITALKIPADSSRRNIKRGRADLFRPNKLSGFLIRV